MADRNEILINFQAITGIEDVAACFDILEQKNWDLSSAVNSVFSEHVDEQNNSASAAGAPPPPIHGPTHMSYEANEAVVDLTTQGSTRSDPIDLSASNSSYREPVQAECSLGVYHQNRLIHIQLPGSATISELKERLHSETGIRPSEQELSGWPFVVSDEVTLENTGIIFRDPFHLRVEQRPQPFLPPSLHPGSSHFPRAPPPRLGSAHFSQAPPPYSSLSAVQQESTSHHALSMPVLVAGKQPDWQNRFSGVEVNHNHDRAGSSGMSGGVAIGGGVERDFGRSSTFTRRQEMETNTVTVRSHTPSPSSSQYSDAVEQFSEDGEEHHEMYESLDDALFSADIGDNPSSKAMRQPLMPQGCTEPDTVLQQLTHNFAQRYGPMHPLFYVGPLSAAVREATSGPASSGTRKPMFIYLHHDGSVLSNVFCSQLLCSESVVNYLSRNFISWAWDLTFHEHRIKLLKMVEESFGKSAKGNVDEIRADHLPCILIVYKMKGVVDIRNIIQGETNLDALMTTLITAVEEHNVQLEREIQEEQDRIAREFMIAEQNRAYQESLDADREKERQRVEKERAEEEEKQARIAEIATMSSCVPDEPSVDAGEKVCTFRIRFPDGQQQQRRFLATHTLQDLFNFLGSKEYLTSEYKILRSFPRKDLTEMDWNQTLEQAQLCPQETLFLEER